MKIAYIAGPYRADTINGIVQNIRKAEEVAIKYWKKGYIAYCPHKNTALFDGILPDDVWIKGNLEMLKRCDIVVMISGWMNSQGSIREHNLAKQKGMEIVYE